MGREDLLSFTVAMDTKKAELLQRVLFFFFLKWKAHIHNSQTLQQL